MAITLNGTTGITLPNGSASAPAATGSDTDTGIVYGTNTVQIATGGTTAVTVDSSQNVGIGTSSTSTTAVQPCLFIGTGNSGASYNSTVRAVGYSSTAQLRYTFNHAGAGYGWGIGSSGGSDFIIGTVADGATGSVSSEKMRIDSSGNLLVNTTSVIQQGSLSVVAGTSYSALGIKGTNSAYDTMNIWTLNPAGSNYYHIAFRYGASATQVGSIYSTSSATTYATSSDYRLKEDIVPMTGALATVAQLKPCTYTWKVDGSQGQGFIAHELAEVCPDAVVGEKDAVNEDGTIKPQGIDTSFLVATLTAAIQELKAELDTVKTELATLKGTA